MSTAPQPPPSPTVFLHLRMWCVGPKHCHACCVGIQSISIEAWKLSSELFIHPNFCFIFVSLFRYILTYMVAVCIKLSNIFIRKLVNQLLHFETLSATYEFVRLSILGLMKWAANQKEVKLVIEALLLI